MKKLLNVLSTCVRRLRAALRGRLQPSSPSAPGPETAPVDAAPTSPPSAAALALSTAPAIPLTPPVQSLEVLPSPSPSAVPAAPPSGPMIAQEPGLTCPRCLHRIPVSIGMLLSGGPVICSRCFLQLGIDRERSKESLAALSTLDQRLEQARRMTQEH